MQVGTFPFGQPILPLMQKDQSPKRIFVLGVYASAVHARWIGSDGKQKVGALAVASEPEIFWCGCNESAKEIIAKIQLPPGAGHLVPASRQLNGPSGKALDDLFLAPLGATRDDAWLCDLVPYSCMNEKQAEALKREYDPVKDDLKLPPYKWPLLPPELATAERRSEIEKEIINSQAEVILTLGDQPVKWFTKFYGTVSKLSAYGETSDTYGRMHPLEIAGRRLQLLPLVHPRQAAKLGSHSTRWSELHESWVAQRVDSRAATLTAV